MIKMKDELTNPVCPHCYSRELVKYGWYDCRQRYLCLACKKTMTFARQRKPRSDVDLEKMKRRGDEVRKMRAGGMTYKVIGDAIGVSRQRVHQILTYYSEVVGGKKI